MAGLAKLQGYSLPLAAALALAGCTSLGASRLGIDRSQYSEKLRESGKEEMLLNIVALQHGDAPLFLQVSSVISQYTREGSLSGSVAISPAEGDARGSAGGEVLLRETPTITYTPISGDRFAKSILGPLPPAALLGMIEGGWPPEVLFPITVRSINGVFNTSSSRLFPVRHDPRFQPMIDAFGRLQKSGGLQFHVRHRKEGGFEVLAQPSKNPGSTDLADLALLRESLGLEGGPAEPKAVVFGSVPSGAGQLSISTRSMFEIFAEAGQGIDGSPTALISIHGGSTAPADAHVAAKYRGRWYWIDGSDRRSILNFLVLQILLSLTDTGDAANAPLVTIPAG